MDQFASGLVSYLKIKLFDIRAGIQPRICFFRLARIIATCPVAPLGYVASNITFFISYFMVYITPINLPSFRLIGDCIVFPGWDRLLRVCGLIYIQ